MPTWTKDQLREYQARRLPSRAQPEPAICHDAVAAPSGARENAIRVHVRFTSYRKRLLDRTNLEAGIKYLEDCLVYSGLVSGDSEAEITRTVRQIKVAGKSEERTEIEIREQPVNK